MALPKGICIGVYGATVDPDAGGYTTWPRAVWISWGHVFALRGVLRGFAENDHLPPAALNGIRTAIKAQLLGAQNAGFVQSEDDDWFVSAIQKIVDDPFTLAWIAARVIT